MSRFISLVVLLFFVGISAKAQIQVSDASTGLFSPNDLIQNVFLGSGVEIVNIQYNGRSTATGFFNNGNNTVGLERGILLSTGLVNSAATPNTEGNTSGDTSGSEIVDQDLEDVASGSLEDIARYIITFIPTSDTLRFNYVFASEEYPEFVCSNFNDVFGFFITGPNPSGGTYQAENIALIPDPAGTGFTNFPVSINSVNPGMIGSNAASGNCSAITESLSFSQYYNDNTGSTSFTYDGFTNVFTAEAIVTPCEQYTIKLAIGDGTDSRFDSSVLLEAKSFGTSGLNVEVETVSVDGSLAESCAEGSISFSFENKVTVDTPIDFSILIGGGLVDAATEGVDFTISQSSIVVPQGATSADLSISALIDNLTEGIEFIYIDYQANICRRDTIAIPLRDNELLPQVMPADVTICNGESYFIDTELPSNFTIPTAPSFSYKGTETIGISGDPMQPDYIFPLTVMGVSPEVLSSGLINRVCIDTFIALSSEMAFYEFYLISPSGQVLELSTNNGVGLANPANPLQVDTLLNLCFTEFASTNVNNGNSIAGPFFPGNRNYTGNFASEGEFSDLFDNDPVVNGSWQMFVRVNDTPSDFGINNNINQLQSWSIFFEAPYSISYDWIPADSVSCASCPDVTVSPSQDTEYTIVTTDSYGCEVSSSITVSVREVPPLPEDLICNVLNNSTIQFSWAIPAQGTIEFMLNGIGGWQPAASNRLDIPGLGFNETQSISIRINNDGCIGPELSTSCVTPSCPAPFISLDAVIPASCSYTPDGSFVLTAVGGSAPYTFATPFETNTTGLFVSVLPDNYTVTVTDNVNCSVEFNVSIESPDSLTSELEILSLINCHDDDQGSIQAIVGGGTMPYNYAWNLSTDTDNQLDNLSADLYIVTVTDFNNCEIIDSVELINPEPLLISNVEISPIACGGDSVGEIYLEIDGGIAPYDFSWSNGISINNDTITGLGSGTYEVTVTDAFNCTATDEIILTQPDPLVASFVNVPTRCHDSDDGASTITVSGGEAPYSYQWSEGSIARDQLNLEKGIVTVTVTDNSLCSMVFSTEIQGPDPIDLNLNSTLVTCFDGDDGSISFDPQGGSGTFTVLRNGVVSSSPISNLSAGAYQFTAIDGNGCNASETITVNQPDSIEISAQSTTAVCFGESTGEIVLEVNGGIGPYRYSWSGSGVSMETDSIVSNLTAGSYTVTVTDLNDCQNTASFDINNSSFLDYTINAADVLCTGDSTGRGLLVDVTGNGPFTYNWSSQDGTITGVDSFLQDIPVGIYYVTISDNTGCGRLDSIRIEEPDNLPTITFESDLDTICFGAEGVGSATISLSGGTGTLFAIWEHNGSSDLTVFDLNLGYNRVTVGDGFGCETIDSFLVIEQDSIEVYLSSEDSSCKNIIDAKVHLDSIVLGGVRMSTDDYFINWSTGDQNILDLEGLIGGVNYRVTVTDQLSCTSVAEIRPSNPESINLSLVNAEAALCNGSNDGSIEIEASGGIAPYSFLWDVNTNFQDSSFVSDLFAGQYTVTVTDNNGCTNSGMFLVEEPLPISANFRVFDNFCPGDSTGKLDIIVSGGTLPYRYEWSSGDMTSETDNLLEGLYTVTVTDGNQCVFIDSASVSGPESDIDFTVESFDVDCEGYTTGSFIVTANGGNGLYTYSIDGTDFSSNPEIIALAAGEYSITVRDNKGCEVTKDGYRIADGVNAFVDLGDDVVIPSGGNYVIPLVTNIDLAEAVITWSTSGEEEALTCLDCPDQSVIDIQGSTIINVEIFTEEGCIARDAIKIEVERFIYIEMPTGFTPNGDGVNDVFSVLGRLDTQVNYFKVYDRWGEKVYENVDFLTNQLDIGWDGTFRNQDMPPGEYIWIVELELEDGTREVFKGSTTLVR